MEVILFVFVGLICCALGAAALLPVMIWGVASLFDKSSRNIADEARTRRHKSLDLDQVDEMDGWDFEEYVASLLRHQGYHAEVTSGSNDFGVDIIATQGQERIAFQVKRYTGHVSRHAVSGIRQPSNPILLSMGTNNPPS